MAKKFLTLFAFLLIALCSSAFAEGPHLVTIHETVVNNIYSQDLTAAEGETDYVHVGASYDTARFFCVTLEIVSDDDEMPYIETFCPPSISFDLSGGKYSFWDSFKIAEVNNTAKTFTTARTESLFNENNIKEALRWGVNKFAYVPTNSEGDWVHFVSNDAETGLTGVTVTWRYPENYSSGTGTATVPELKTTAQQLADFVPYIEYKTTGTMGSGDLKCTSIEWKLVKSNDVEQAIQPSQDIHFEIVSIFGINNNMDKADSVLSTDIASGNNASGSKTLETPLGGVPWCTIVRYYVGGNKNIVYQWRFISVNEGMLGQKLVRDSAYNGGSAVFHAGLTDGKSDYTYARYDSTSVTDVAMWPFPDFIEAKHLTEGTLTIKKGGTFTILDSDGEVFQTFNSPDIDITFPLHTRTALGNSYLEYSYMTEGYRKEHWTYINDCYSTRGTMFKDETGSLSGKEVSWEFPKAPELNGSGKIGAATSLAHQYDKSTGGFFPYVELVSEDGYITAVNYRLVQSPDIATAYDPSNTLSVKITIDVQTEYGATWNIPNGTLSNATYPKDDGSRTSWQSDFKTSGTLALKEKIKLGEYTAVNVYLAVFPFPYNADNYYGDSYYAKVQDGVTHGALTDGNYMNSPTNWTGYTWRFVDEPPMAETHVMKDDDISNVSEDKLAETLELSDEEFNFAERGNIFEETQTTPEALNFFKGNNTKMVGRFKKLYGRKPGWYVTKIKLPPELYDSINGISADLLKVYSLTDSELQEQAQEQEQEEQQGEIRVSGVSLASVASVRLAANEPTTGSLVNLDGSKVDKIDGTEFLMVSYLESTTSEISNMYLGLAEGAETPATSDNNGSNGNDNSETETPAADDNKGDDNKESDSNNNNNNEAETPPSDDNKSDNSNNNSGTDNATIVGGGLILVGNSTLEDAINSLTDAQAAQILSIPADTAANLTEINASTFAKLINLKSVDLTKATKLTVIVLDSTSSITDIKLGQNNSSLTTINIAGSKVERLDAPNCTGVTSINLRNCAALQYADLTSADITSLDLTGCTSVQTLKVGGCKIQSITGLASCAATLTELNVKGNSILMLDLTNFSKLINPLSVDLSGQARDGWIATAVIKWAEFFAEGENVFKTADESTNYAGKIKITNPASGFTQDSEGNVTFSSVPESFSYLYESKANIASMDVTISGESSANNNLELEGSRLGGSGGGCNIGFNLLLAALMLKFFKKK